MSMAPEERVSLPGEVPRTERLLGTRNSELGTEEELGTASPWRAWWALVGLSWQRQARARQMVWLALGLLALATAVVAINTARVHVSGLDHWKSPSGGRGALAHKSGWGMYHWRYPPRQGPTFDQWNHDGQLI